MLGFGEKIVFRIEMLFTPQPNLRVSSYHNSSGIKPPKVLKNSDMEKKTSEVTENLGGWEKLSDLAGFPKTCQVCFNKRGGINP